MSRNIFYLIFSGFLLFASCATLGPQYRNPDEEPEYPSEKTVEKTFFLIGDAGYSEPGGMSDGLQTLQNFLATHETSGDYALFLGDNIYPVGMPAENHPERKTMEYRLDAQYNAIKGYDGQIIFIPGNHDWYNEGLLGLKREEDYLESKIKDRKVFKPENGCPLESISVSDNIQLIILDTQWYLEDWNKHPTINQPCEIKTREKLFIELEFELKQHQNKTIVFALHHPMFTNGNHGGYFSFKKHIYPTQKKIPLPILSSMVVQIRSQGGVSVQDRYNELYNNLMIRLQQLVQNNQRIVFAAGHEHSLQYIEQDGIKQIVSGSGSKASYAAIGEHGLYSDGRQGFAVLDVFTDGSSWVRFFTGNENHEPQLTFQKEVNAPVKNYDYASFPNEFPSERAAAIYTQDSINEALFFKTVWGAKYKEAYSKPVTAKVAKLDSIFDGLVPVRENGDGEYRSLLLKDKYGNEYSMRSLSKNALKISQKMVYVDEDASETMEETPQLKASSSYNRDFYTASHPYAVMAIPTLAHAIDVFYTTPALFYVPKQQALGNYNENFGNELYMISVEPTEKNEGDRIFNYADDIGTTDDILYKLRQDEEIFVDEENYIKSRLFDMLIGDWDRESDHWRWAEYFNRYGKNVYVPIPRNRNDAFSSFDGNILDLAQNIFGGTRQSHVYGENLTDLKWFNEEGIILDRALLQRSGRNQWVYSAEQIQKNLTDEVIEAAFNTIPEEVRDETIEEIKSKLKGRLENLADIADRYYTYLSSHQNIVGTDGNDYFEITRLPNAETNIKTFRLVDGVKSDTLLNRNYKHKDTKEIWVYGLGGEDVFEVKGDEDNLIYLRLIGSHGNDVYRLVEGRRVKVYDHESLPSTVETRKGGNLRFTDVYTLNTYDYRKQISRDHSVVPAFGYNPDDGFRAAFQYSYRIDNFQRNPFSQKHILSGAFYFDTSSFELAYSGEFANIRNDLNLYFGARATSANYNVNYFGYGNETVNPEDEKGYDFNRVELQTFKAHAGLLRNSSFGSIFKFQGNLEAITANSSPANLVSQLQIIEARDTKYFATAEGIYQYRSFDNISNPTIGMMFDLNLGVTDNLQDTERVFGFLKTSIGFYNTLITNRKLVLKTNVRYQQNFGRLFEFYQGVSLGGETGLRGFREERFTGKSLLAGSADVRYSFKEFNLGLFPIQIGIYGGVDLGRVWIPHANSQKWHNSRGGGLWIQGLGGLNGTFSAFNSEEGTRYSFGLGFSF